ncbi:hypothetical protein CXG50_10950 [Pseudomonas plecoglossicida]|nr:hypothetical protein CXG50_10950 [Pseudomonas plecoglossicida]
MVWGCLVGPYRRQASSHRYPTASEPSGEPVGAGLPAIGPEAKKATRRPPLSEPLQQDQNS